MHVQLKPTFIQFDKTVFDVREVIFYHIVLLSNLIIVCREISSEMFLSCHQCLFSVSFLQLCVIIENLQRQAHKSFKVEGQGCTDACKRRNIGFQHSGSSARYKKLSPYAMSCGSGSTNLTAVLRSFSALLSTK